jgi:perosamine synthetase
MCAQRYTTRAALEPRVSDVRLFSFGLLKTGTALGGAIAEVGDSRLRARMEQVQSHWRPQTRRAYAGKVMKSLLFIALQQPLGYRFFARVCAMAGSSSGEVVRRLTRGFGRLEGKALLDAFRRRPSRPLLRMLAWRLTREDGKRVLRRARAGERMFHRLKETSLAGTVMMGAAQADRTHWVVPISTSDPDAVRRELATEGFDACGASNVVAIGGREATRMIEGLVFLPCYPEMNARTRDRIAAVVTRSVTGARQTH